LAAVAGVGVVILAGLVDFWRGWSAGSIFRRGRGGRGRKK